MFKAIKEFFLGKPVEQQPIAEAPAPYKVETPAPVAEIPTLTEVVEPVAEKKPAPKKPAPKKQQFDKKPAAKKAGRKPKAKPETV